jgi:hypothetical protein
MTATTTSTPAAVMTLAIFRQTYRYPAVPFRSIGRKAFAWALRKAWADTKAAAAERARVAAITADEKTARIVALREHAALAEFADHYPSVVAARAAVAAEIAALSS